MAKPGAMDGAYAAVVPLTSQCKGTRLALTTSSAALTAGRLTTGELYKLSLEPTSSSACFVQFAASATLPASDAAVAEGFWLLPGETEIVTAGATRLAGIMISGTGTLLVTKLVT